MTRCHFNAHKTRLVFGSEEEGESEGERGRVKEEGLRGEESGKLEEGGRKS